MTTQRARGGAVLFSVLLVVSVLVSGVAFAGTAAAQSKSADVVFVFDETGSMDTQAEALKNEVGNVAEELEAQGIDARYGLVTYEDAESTDVDLPLSGNPDDLKIALEGISTFGGTENASHGIRTALDMDYRTDAQKIIVVITDEDDDGTLTARQQTLQRIDDEGACLVAVSPDWYQNDIEGADELKTMSGAVECGEWTDVNTESFTTVVTDLIEVIKQEASETKRGTENLEVLEKSVSSTTVHTNETFTAEIVVDNEAGSRNRFHALITDINQVLYSERVIIGPYETRTISIPLAYPEAGTYTLRSNHRYINDVTVKERPLNESDVAVTDGTVKRSVVLPNESYEVSATVENVGDQTGYATVSFASGPDLNNTTHVTNETVRLTPNETATVVHEAIVEANSSENMTWTANGAILGNVSVLSGEDAEVGIDEYAQPKSVSPGESYDVTGVVYNTGNESRMVSVNISPQEGQLGGVQMVNVGGNESIRISKTVEAPTDTDATNQTWWVNDEPVNVTIVSTTSN